MSVSLPMYDFPDVREATDAWWSGLRRHLGAQGVDAPAKLLRRDDLIEQWMDRGLVISQTCGYLLTHQMKGDLRAVATPHYTAPGCEGPNYASVILAGKNHGGRRLEDFAGAVAVYSRSYSHAGYNAFRGMVAPLAKGRAFFGRVIASDSHLGSIAALACGEGDLATVDGVIHAFVQRWRPETLEGTRVLGFTPKAPAPPYVAPIGASPDRVARLRAALDAAVADPELASEREALFIGGFSPLGIGDYAPIPTLERQAAASGYPDLR